MRTGAPTTEPGAVVRARAAPTGLLVDKASVVALGELVPGAVHELNNPLFAILGLAELLQADAGPGTREHERLGLIQQCAVEIRDIVRALLMFAEPDLEVHESSSLPGVMHDTLALVRRLVPAARDARISEEYALGVPEVQIPESRLRQAALVLLLACLERTHGETVLEVRVTHDGDAVLVLSLRGPEPNVESLGIAMASSIARTHGGLLIAHGGAGGGLELHLPAVGEDE